MDADSYRAFLLQEMEPLTSRIGIPRRPPPPPPKISEAPRTTHALIIR